jgi:hypothetical protein
VPHRSATDVADLMILEERLDLLRERSAACTRLSSQTRHRSWEASRIPHDRFRHPGRRRGLRLPWRRVIYDNERVRSIHKRPALGSRSRSGSGRVPSVELLEAPTRDSVAVIKRKGGLVRPASAFFETESFVRSAKSDVGGSVRG